MKEQTERERERVVEEEEESGLKDAVEGDTHSF